ncbi:hypothetical protein [Sinomicrobium sp.]
MKEIIILCFDLLSEFDCFNYSHIIIPLFTLVYFRLYPVTKIQREISQFNSFSVLVVEWRCNVHLCVIIPKHADCIAVWLKLYSILP